MAYSEELLKAIREDRENGLTYKEIMLKHGLKSNYAIKIALGKVTGADKKYAGRYNERYRKARENERKYGEAIEKIAKLKNKLDAISKELEDLINAFITEN